MKRFRSFILMICVLTGLLCLTAGRTSLAEPKAYDDLPPEDGIAAGMECIHIFSTDYFSFRIPDVWMAIDFVSVPNTEDSISFHCRPAWKEDGQEDGKVCTILREYEDLGPDYFPSASYLGTKDGNYFYLLYPTDVRCDPSDQTIIDKYNVMLEAAHEIPETFELK